LQSILESSQDAIVGADGAGNITSWNDAAAAMFGYTKQEAVGQSLQILMPIHYKNRHQSALDASTEEAEQAKKKGGRPGVKKYDKIYSVRGVAKNGTEFPVEISVTSFILGGKMRYNSIIRDLSSFDTGDAFIPEESRERVDVAKTANQLLKDKAVKLGAMMQTAHALSSSTFITKAELADVINKGMVEAKLESNAELRKQKCEGVASAIMQDASRDEQRIYFVDLIPMLLKRGITVTDQGALQLKSSRVRQAVKTPYEKFVSDAKKFFKTYKWHIVWMLGLFAINLTLFLTAFFEFKDKGANEWIQVARGGGRMLNFDCAVIVLPMCRKALGYLRTTFMKKFTPFDESIEFHKVISYYILFATTLHTIAHFGNYLTPTMSACPGALAPKYGNFSSRGGVGKGDCNFGFWLFETQPGLTGFLLLITILFIYGGANETIRRGSDAQRKAPTAPAPAAASTPTRRGSTSVKQLSSKRESNWRQIYSHSVFFFTHHLFVVFFLLILIHGYGLETDIGNPNFYKYFLACAPIYIVERFIRDGLAKREDLRILKAVTLPGKVVALYVQKPKVWDVKAGMYLFIQVPDVSSFEWHPFTITSAPEDPFVSVHIKVLGDWTTDLYKMFLETPHDALSIGSSQSSNYMLPVARIDGPYGAPTQDVFNFKTSVVVGAGIGATPSISILRHILWKMRLNDPANVPSLQKTIANATLEELTEALERKKSDPLFTLKKLYFIWSNRDAEAFQWFAAVLGSVESHPAVDIRAFLTSSSLGKDDLNAFLLRIGMESQVEQGQADVVTSLKSVVTQYRR
jgi:PAS domain S-box-containing protein